MIRLLIILLIASTLPAFAEGPQEQALDRSLQQMQAQDPANNSPATYSAAPVTSAMQAPSTKPARQSIEGHNEQLMDEGLQPESPPDPAGDAMVRKLNGGQ